MKVTILTANLQNKLSFLNRAVSPKDAITSTSEYFNRDA